MAKKIYLVMLCVIVLAGVAMVIQFGLKPRSISKIGISSFSSFDDLGRTAYKRLRFETQERDIIVVGALPERLEAVQVWQGFLGAMSDDGIFIHNIYIDDALKTTLPIDHLERFHPAEGLDKMLEEIKETRQQKQRWVIIVESAAASHLVEGNFVHKLEEALHEPVMSLSLAPLLNNKEEEPMSPVPCGEEPGAGTERPNLGCIVRNTSRMNYKKIKDPKQLYGVLEQYGIYDYLLFTNQYKGGSF